MNPWSSDGLIRSLLWALRPPTPPSPYPPKGPYDSAEVAASRGFPLSLSSRHSVCVHERYCTTKTQMRFRAQGFDGRLVGVLERLSLW